MSENKKEPLHYYKLDRNTGKIIVRDITDYVLLGYGKGYRWKDKSQYKFCYTNELDRFKNDHVYSFELELDDARRIIEHSLQTRAEAAFRTYEEMTELIRRIERKRNELQ